MKVFILLMVYKLTVTNTMKLTVCQVANDKINASRTGSEFIRRSICQLTDTARDKKARHTLTKPAPVDLFLQDA